jgi:glycosyltransferase involved in cell wall biosynthesis
VKNEGERIRRQLVRLRPYAKAVDVLIADWGSTDGSLEPKRLRRSGVRALLTKTGPGRLGAQMRMAMAFALREGYAGLLFMDGNDKDDPSAIPRFVAELRRGGDHVQGSRYVPGGEGVNTPRVRHWAVRLLHAPLLSHAAGFRYTDTTNGFRAYSARFLLDPRVCPFRAVFSGYELHYYLAVRAAELGFSVVEIPVRREYPAKGKTPTKISPVRGSIELLRALVRTALHRYDPPTTKGA